MLHRLHHFDAIAPEHLAQQAVGQRPGVEIGKRPFGEEEMIHAKGLVVDEQLPVDLDHVVIRRYSENTRIALPRLATREIVDLRRRSPTRGLDML